MASREEKIKEFEKELSTTKYNKRTQHHVGLIKAKIAKLKEEEIKKSFSGKKGGGYSIRRTGDATVILLGFPSVGKSTLLNKLTNAKSPVGEYDFTTLTVIPGLLEYKNAKIQLLDVPGIVYGAASGKGRGREVLSVIRSADLIIILVDAYNPQQKRAIEKEIYDSGIRLNQQKPDVRIKRKPKGGISIGTTVKLTNLPLKTAEGILREMGFLNADVIIRDNITDDQLIDVAEENKVYIPSLVVINKIDLLDKETLQAVKEKIKPDLIISAEKEKNLEGLKKQIFEKLSLIRIYLKQIGKKPDMEEPLIMQKGCTIQDICLKLHQDFVKKFRFARVWGSSKFEGQPFRKLDKELFDQDIIEIHLN